MPFHATVPRRERILAMGPAGSGKSTAWLNIAEWYHKTETPGRLFVADTDLAWEGQRPVDGHLDERVISKDVFDWPSLIETVEKAAADYQDGDWLVVDMISAAWTYAQQHYYEEVFGKELDVFFLEAKKAGTNPGGEWGSNWTVINKLHSSFMQKLQRYPGHLLACTPATDVRQPDARGGGGDTREILHLFGKLGVKPEGQKLLAYNFHTVLLFQDVPRAGYTITTAKDRNREVLTGESLDEFCKSYLIRVGGWRV